jgi:hypothetical protein
MKKESKYKAGSLLFDEIANEFGIILKIKWNYYSKTNNIYCHFPNGECIIPEYQLDDWIEEERFEVCD